LERELREKSWLLAGLVLVHPASVRGVDSQRFAGTWLRACARSLPSLA
jgi:hypothetical protein